MTITSVRARHPKAGYRVHLEKLRFVCYNDYTSTAKELGCFLNQSIVVGCRREGER